MHKSLNWQLAKIRVPSIILLGFLLISSSIFAQKKKTFRTNGETFQHSQRTTDKSFSATCVQEQFRTINGTCNNTTATNRADWGASDIQLFRAIDSQYGEPDSWNDMGGQNRPSPRVISNNIVAQNNNIESSKNLSSFVFTWGQFLDHDITLTPESEVESVPIELPADEPLFTFDISFHRSAIYEGTGEDNPRQQINLLTSWIDASNVYGSDEHRAQWLRTFVDGKLKTSSGDLLPFNTIDGEFDSDIDPNAPSMAGDDGGETKTYVAGDVRAAEQPGLSSLHTLFVREHNRICTRLKSQGILDDELLYQMARKRVGALVQAITYQEFLPALGIDLSPSSYKPNLRPDITNIFATAAYRLGHTMVTEELLLRDDDCQSIDQGSVSLIDGFFNPEILQNYNISPILKGLSMQVQQEVDVHIIDNLRNFLFVIPGLPGAVGLDLASLNLQRGRDHGLPDYNTIRAHYLGQPAQNFGQITANSSVRNALQNTYDDVNDIDAWVGLLAENHLSGKSVGRTLNAILVDQFTKLRDGDFYYFQHDPYLSNQLRQQIENTRLSDIIERNTDLDKIQNNVFFADDCLPNGGGNGPGGGNHGGGGHNGGGHGNGGNGHGNGNGGGNFMDTGFQTPNPAGILLAYPNPTADFIQIELQVEEMTEAQIRLYDSKGRIVNEEKKTDLSNLLEQRLNLSDFTPGIYWLQIQTTNGIFTEKIVLNGR